MLSAGSALKQYQTTAINKYLAFILNYLFHHNAFVIWLLVIWIIKSDNVRFKYQHWLLDSKLLTFFEDNNTFFIFLFMTSWRKSLNHTLSYAILKLFIVLDIMSLFYNPFFLVFVFTFCKHLLNILFVD